LIIEKFSVFACVAFASGTLALSACAGSSDGSAQGVPQGGGAGANGGAATAGAAGSPTNSGGAGGSALAGAAGALAGSGGAGGLGEIAGSGGSGGSAGSSGGAAGSSASDPGAEGDGLRTVPQPFKAAPETVKQDGVPHGKILKFTIAGNSSKIYPKCPNREVNVYVPTQYVTGTPAPVMVVQDGNQFYGFVDTLSNTLDNLINAKKLPPIVAVFANNGGGDAMGSERGLEYDTLSGVYGEWVDQELLPRVEQETKTQLAAQAVTFTKDPEGRAAMGGSSGGAASFIMLWYHPDLYRRAVTFSASFVAQESPKNPDHPLGAWNFHEDGKQDAGGIIVKTDPIKPIRVWLEAGTADNNHNMSYPYYDIEFGNRQVQLKMTAKGYHVHLDIGTNATHVDGGMIRQTLPEALLWTWRGYQGVK